MTIVARRHVLAALGGGALTGLAAPRGAGASLFDRAVYVDLDAAWLYALDGARVTLASRVVVGHAETPTPSANSTFTRVNFRPSWRPTPSMIARGDYEDGVRRPGPDNPLGLATIHYVGGGLIYLHGTNEPKLYAERFRALSSGCVRVHRLAEFIAWLLGWTVDRVNAAMHGDRTFAVSAPAIALVMARRNEDSVLTPLEQAVSLSPAWASTRQGT